MNKSKSKRGRPTNYTPELAVIICSAIATSSKGIKNLCKYNPGWPSKDTIFTWLKTHSEFSDQYAQAKRLQIEVLVEEIIDIADDTSNDTILNANGQSVCYSEWINRSRLRIDTRKWIASKLVPKIYGNKVDNLLSFTHTTHEECLKLLM